ncbi:MAG: NAD(P)H-hydrate dehydratase, partial [Woeseiaceae bacterium]
PSGLHGDSGAILGNAVRADLTVTFVGLKAGLFLGDAPACTGDVAFAGLDIPADCRARIPVQMRRMDDSLLRATLPPRRRDAHKGDFGHLLLVGGGPGMSGAIRLAGIAALRSGAGRVSIATHPSCAPTVATGCAELMVHGIAEAGELAALLKRVDTLAVGPGLGTDAWAHALLLASLEAGLPCVLDADALNLLHDVERRAKDWILTPHPGEAARLLGVAASDVQKDRQQALAALQERYGGTIVLKGANTLVSADGQPAWLCLAGNPGMAAPGMGDVLTGVIAGLLAQKLAPETAAVCGVLAHALAGDAAAAIGQRGMLASDLLPELRAVLNP